MKTRRSRPVRDLGELKVVSLGTAEIMGRLGLARMDHSSTAQLTILQRSAELLDPHIWTDDRDRLSVRRALFEALVGYHPSGGYRPALATGWTLSADARAWTFRIRPARLHDGTELDAQAVVAALDRARGPGVQGELGTSGLYRSYLGPAAITALDADTVQIVTHEPMADLLDLLVEIPIVAADPRVGTGPYRLVEEDQTGVLLARFGRYWGERPAAERVRWRGEPDDQRRAEALLHGEADLVADLPPGALAPVKDTARCAVLAQESKWATVFMCNAARGVCTDRRVRQALNYALDVPQIIDLVQPGGARPLNGPLTPLHFGYDPTARPYPHDLAQARALLAAAGCGDGLHLVLDVPTRLPDEAPQLAAAMADHYAGVGIATEVRVFADRPAYAELVKAKGMDDACCFDSSPLSTWRVLREKFHSAVRGAWWQGYANRAVDALLDRAARTPDDARRQALYRRACRLIRDDAPWIFLYRPVLTWGAGSKRHCFELAVDGVIELV